MENLFRLITEELYGSHPALVVYHLSAKGPLNLKSIQTACELELKQTRNALVVLLQHRVVTYNNPQNPKYTLHTTEVLRRVRFPRYIRIFNLNYGETGVPEVILENGCLSLGQISESLQNSLDENLITDMVDKGYLQGVDSKVEEPPKSRPRKKRKVEKGTVYYSLNFSKLDKEILSKIVGDLVSSKVNAQAAIVAEVIFKLAYERPFVKSEVFESLPKDFKITKAGLDGLLELMQNEDIVLAVSSSNFKLNLDKIRSETQLSTLDKVVKGRFSDYHMRVFKVLRVKGMLDDKAISELTLLPMTEARLCVNELYSAGFLQFQNINNQMLYSVRTEDVKEDILQQLYTSMHNLKLRLKSEMDEAWDLAQRIGTLSTEERVQLERYKQVENRIESAILELDKTILIFTQL